MTGLFCVGLSYQRRIMWHLIDIADDEGRHSDMIIFSTLFFIFYLTVDIVAPLPSPE